VPLRLKDIARKAVLGYCSSLLKEGFEKLLKQFTRVAKEHYGDRLVSIAVYGSVGRETFRHDSDIDCLIICKDLPKGRRARVDDFLVIEEKLSTDLKQLRNEGISTEFSPVLKTPEEVLKGSPLFLDMVEDAKILFDSEGFLNNYLQELKYRLKKLGAKRVWRANAWYWILKPDLQPGEIFEI
jgi:predicted nucleotidyltransferase